MNVSGTPHLVRLFMDDVDRSSEGSNVFSPSTFHPHQNARHQQYNFQSLSSDRPTLPYLDKYRKPFHPCSQLKKHMNISKLVNRRNFVTASLVSVTGVGTYAFCPNQVTSERFVAWAKGQTRLKNAKPRRQPKSEQIERYSVEITNYLDEDDRHTIADSFVYDRLTKIDQLSDNPLHTYRMTVTARIPSIKSSTHLHQNIRCLKI